MNFDTENNFLTNNFLNEKYPNNYNNDTTVSSAVSDFLFDMVSLPSTRIEPDFSPDAPILSDLRVDGPLFDASGLSEPSLDLAQTFAFPSEASDLAMIPPPETSATGAEQFVSSVPASAFMLNSEILQDTPVTLAALPSDEAPAPLWGDTEFSFSEAPLATDGSGLAAATLGDPSDSSDDASTMLARGVGRPNKGDATDVFVLPGQGSGGRYNGDGGVRSVPSGAPSIPTTPVRGSEISPGGFPMRPAPERVDYDGNAIDRDGSRVPSRRPDLLPQSVNTKEMPNGGRLLCKTELFTADPQLIKGSNETPAQRIVTAPFRSTAQVVGKAGIILAVQTAGTVTINGKQVTQRADTYVPDRPSIRATVTHDLIVTEDKVNLAGVPKTPGTNVAKYDIGADTVCKFVTPTGVVTLTSSDREVRNMPLPAKLPPTGR